MEGAKKGLYETLIDQGWKPSGNNKAVLFRVNPGGYVEHVVLDPNLWEEDRQQYEYTDNKGIKHVFYGPEAAMGLVETDSSVPAEQSGGNMERSILDMFRRYANGYENRQPTEGGGLERLIRGLNLGGMVG